MADGQVAWPLAHRRILCGSRAALAQHATLPIIEAAVDISIQDYANQVKPASTMRAVIGSPNGGRGTSGPTLRGSAAYLFNLL